MLRLLYVQKCLCAPEIDARGLPSAVYYNDPDGKRYEGGLSLLLPSDSCHSGLANEGWAHARRNCVVRSRTPWTRSILEYIANHDQKLRQFVCREYIVDVWRVDVSMVSKVNQWKINVVLLFNLYTTDLYQKVDNSCGTVELKITEETS